jgi:glycolate oxidase FAD binding subunit
MIAAQRLSALAGAPADAAGAVPRVTPPSIEACALVLAEASRRGWRVRVEGAGRWSDPATPADLVLSTRGLNRIDDVAPADLVATVQGGVAWDALDHALAPQGLWVPVDAPTASEPRTAGSVAATGTPGPLRAGFGAMRDQLLGITLVTGDGRIVRAGGRVAKNVAGYDLTRLAAGSYGAFGLIAAMHLRLRRLPQVDVTASVSGGRDDLLRAADAALARGVAPAAMELSVQPNGTEWTLAARLMGTEAAVRPQARHLADAAGAKELSPDGARRCWRDAGDLGGRPMSVRVGALPTGMAAACDLLAGHLGAGRISASLAAGSVRWSGTTTADGLAALRHAAAEREMPVTLERAPWTVASASGHFGAYREGVASLVRGLRRVFDPAGIFVVPLNA